MSTSHRPQIQVNTPLPDNKKNVGEYPSHSAPPKSVIPSKRSDDDDDIQFISSQPVKRQKMAEHTPQHTVQRHNIPVIPIVPTLPAIMPPTEFRDSDRRISTGMVGLPSDIHVMELTSALRGVSLPVLEKFGFNQPFRKPRPPSPPELSPKQLPQAISPARPDASTNKHGPRGSKLDAVHMIHMSIGEVSIEPRAPTPSPMTPNSTTDEPRVLNMPADPISSFSSPQTKTPREVESRSVAMPPPQLPKADIRKLPKTPISKKTIQNTHQSDLTRHPCQVCVRMRQHASIAQSQGLPVVHQNISPHIIPHIACHPPYSQHFHPQMMTMGPNNMHAFNPGFPQIMVPVPGNNLAALPSHVAGPMPTNQNQNTKSPFNPENSDDQVQSSPPQLPTPTAPESASAILAAETDSTIPNPVKPPASLIQPTYRKPSPNLIVDVAETCQERFPFEEVAKRHKVPVERVFDVFAAIIQVPLLRCPTDRRRAGRLATSRVKEYTKTKKALQETTDQSGSSPKEEIVVKPSDIADRLGQVDFPDGFSLGE